MTKNDVIETIAKERLVETAIANIAKTNSDDTLKDLSQNIYIDLLLKDEEKIVNLYETNQLRFFIVRMITNNLFSKNSPYYQVFRKNANLRVDIDGLKDKL